MYSVAAAADLRSEVGMCGDEANPCVLVSADIYTQCIQPKLLLQGEPGSEESKLAVSKMLPFIARCMNAFKDKGVEGIEEIEPVTFELGAYTVGCLGSLRGVYRRIWEECPEGWDPVGLTAMLQGFKYKW